MPSWVWLFKIGPFLTELRGPELFHGILMQSGPVPFKNIMLHVILRELSIVDSVLSAFYPYSVSVIMCHVYFISCSPASVVFSVWGIILCCPFWKHH
jgi:hypothetical protein